ncbi:hypothetical protein MSG28_012551 [Choristoneura fumiferana]|uniref:Uncharacterized protein n=1 Tax=Choristoneura fumiferana TaxID=7141 RepID=A0ACC0JH34_CHOFU|nr:hypothetical protein MSG28_012551 [Choristoneura fumiferana]
MTFCQVSCGAFFLLTFWLGGHILFKLAKAWWKEPDTGVPAGARDSCSAARMWRAACSVLVCPDADEAWTRISDVAPPDTVWHSLRNCVAYQVLQLDNNVVRTTQAGVWQNLLSGGVDDAMQPAAFKLAIVLRHTPTDLVVRLLAELLRLHPQSVSTTLAVSPRPNVLRAGAPHGRRGGVVRARAARGPRRGRGWRGGAGGAGAGTPAGPAPLRDLQLFGDCELAILAASREEYEAHAKLVRAEYAALTNKNYVELRIKILNQFSQIPKLYHTPEFECFEPLARENIDREICTLREHLLTGQHDHE